MIVDFKMSFLRDLKKINHKDVLSQIEKTIAQVEKATDIGEISNLKKMSGYKNYYRIRIKDYRLGICIEDNTIYFVRVALRKDIYKLFP